MFKYQKTTHTDNYITDTNSVPFQKNIEGINFIFIKRNGLFFVCATKFNMSPALAIEILTR